MSSRKSKQNKKNNNNNSCDKDNAYLRPSNGTKNANANGNAQLSEVTFKYPGRFATLTRTILLNESLTAMELLRKISPSLCNQAPDAKKVFELYYMDEIYPFINKHAQETINTRLTRKEIAKSWDLQSNHFQKIYVKRSELLRTKWNEMKHETRNTSHSTSFSKINKPINQTFTVTNHHHHEKNGAAQDNGTESDSELTGCSQTVIFKYYSVHSSAKTNRHIFISAPTKKALFCKIKLSLNSTPPTAQDIFEIYYYDEILPFLKKSGQQSIRGKKDLSKVWQIQTKTFKSLYEQRCKILTEEWLKMKKNNKIKKQSQSRSASLLLNKQEKKIMINKHKINKKKSKKINIIRIECSLIRTLLNFLLFVECTRKQDCFMLLVDDQSKKSKKYENLKCHLRGIGGEEKENITYFHLRLFIDNFDCDSLRLHTGQSVIKLCFINPVNTNEELILFELQWNKLIMKLNEKIDHENIEANLDDDTRIIAINVPLL